MQKSVEETPTLSSTLLVNKEAEKIDSDMPLNPETYLNTYHDTCTIRYVVDFVIVLYWAYV